MTNGKVRIYELSKELNLDNKELLAICDQLDIAVKSHSSTIAESDAQRIRSEAEKLAATNAHTRKDSATSQKHNMQHNGSRSSPAASNKQEILEIRKPKLLNNSSTNAVEASSTTNNQFAHSESNPSSPRPFAPVSTMKPTAPIRPVPRNPSETTQSAPADVDIKPNSNQPAEKVAAEKSEKPSAAPRAKAEKAPKPQLVAPPARPAGQENAPSSQQSPVDSGAAITPTVPSEKPLLKRDRSATPQENRAANPGENRSDQLSPSKPKIGKGVEGQPGTPRPARSTAPGGQERKAARQSPPSGGGDVQRPSRPARPPEGGVPAAITPRLIAAPTRPTADTTSANDDTAVVPGGSVLELKRPLPPRINKGGKKWQEEEIDEGKEAKAAKLTKNKRVKPVIEEDFDDDDLLDDDDNDGPDAIQVSNAIVRPPKPKAARPSQPAAVTIASPQKGGRKPAQHRDREQNRNRREAEVKRDRPELLIVTGAMTVQELADALAVADTEIVKILFMKAIPVSITQNLDIATITLVATELEIPVETQEPEAEARKVTEMIEVGDLDKLHRRPPVVTIMGHVDHGKTTLLDSIRKTKVASGEAGGITQHIGAYHVDVEHNGEKQQVVFLDTPGHEAFTAMRARGARVTDIAILVVAADDGVRPQTIEAISHAQAAEVPIIVAINKIDKEGAQPDRVKQELTQYGMTAEEWGGDTIMVPVSAIKGENLDTLLEMILLVAEVGELSANPNRTAKGTVIEAHLDKAKGAVATLLIQNGTLRVGDILVAGCVFGKVRAMVDDRGHRVDAASPSFAVEVLGLSDVPAAGDEFEVFLVEKEARATAAKRAEKIRQSRLMQGRVTLAGISAKAQEGELKELNLILKGDVQGSVEAIVGSLKQLPQNEVQIRLLLSSAGEITQTDIDLAAASGAVIIGFNTTYASGARNAADEAGVDVREYNIIYKLLEDIQDALEGLLEPELVEEPLGQSEVRAVFPVGRGAVAGCYVQMVNWCVTVKSESCVIAR